MRIVKKLKIRICISEKQSNTKTNRRRKQTTSACCASWHLGTASAQAYHAANPAGTSEQNNGSIKNASRYFMHWRAHRCFRQLQNKTTYHHKKVIWDAYLILKLPCNEHLRMKPSTRFSLKAWRSCMFARFPPEESWLRSAAPNLGYMHPYGYICLSERVHLGLTLEGKNIADIFIYF